MELLGRHLEAENAHRLVDTLATLSQDCTFDDMALGKTYHGHEGATSYYRMWWEAFDTTVTPERLHLAGDTAVAETTWRGTHIGEFLGIAPTGREIDVPVIIVVDLLGGLMAAERLYWDRLRLIDQLNT
jgi:steroid delta-isomerase-like uncharacterized protein